MPGETKRAERDLRPTHELIPDEQARRAFSVSIKEVARARIEEMASIIWHHESASQEQINIGIVRAVEHFNSLAPRDGAEAMLAKQMAGTHFAAVECLRRAAIPNQYQAARSQELNQAAKLMTLYARQLDTLNRHRGKGQQKVTVEYVHVAEGGQAIVGHVNAESGLRGQESEAQIAYEPSQEVPLVMAKAKTKVARGKR